MYPRCRNCGAEKVADKWYPNSLPIPPDATSRKLVIAPVASQGKEYPDQIQSVCSMCRSVQWFDLFRSKDHNSACYLCSRCGTETDNVNGRLVPFDSVVTVPVFGFVYIQGRLQRGRGNLIRFTDRSILPFGGFTDLELWSYSCDEDLETLYRLYGLSFRISETGIKMREEYLLSKARNEQDIPSFVTRIPYLYKKGPINVTDNTITQVPIVGRVYFRVDQIDLEKYVACRQDIREPMQFVYHNTKGFDRVCRVILISDPDHGHHNDIFVNKGKWLSISGTEMCRIAENSGNYEPERILAEMRKS